MQTIPIWKIAATSGGTALTGAAVWLNAEHVAHAEGLASPLVLAGIIVTLCAAATPPFAERAAKTGQPLKAAMLWLFFGIVVSFSLTASITRSSGHRDAEVANIEQANAKARLAKEAYHAAKDARQAECATGRGPRCRAAEDAITEARKALASAAPVKASDPGAERLAAVLGIDQGAVTLYVPLLLPLGLELGGFIFLAVGLAPRSRRKVREGQPVQNENDDVSRQLGNSHGLAKLATAKRSPTVAKLIQAATTKPVKPGTTAYYLARLERDHPAIAARVKAGELSCYRGCIEAGIRKPSAKAKKWTNVDAYLKPEKVGT